MTDHFRDATKLLPDLARLREVLAEATIDNFPWQCCVGMRETVEVFNALPALLDAAEERDALRKRLDVMDATIRSGLTAHDEANARLAADNPSEIPNSSTEVNDV